MACGVADMHGVTLDKPPHLSYASFLNQGGRIMSHLLSRASAAAVLAVAYLCITLPPPVSAAELPDPISQPIPLGGLVGLEPVASGLTAPNWARSPPGDTGRLFVVDQTGILWVINLASGEKSGFADLSALLVPLGVGGPGTYDERGFLGLAFHPDYQNNGLLYTYTSEPAAGDPNFPVPFGAAANHHAVVAEWHVTNPQDPASVVDPNSRRVVLRIGEPQFNHNGGALNFGPDGMLFISLGAGGAADDQGPGHNPTTGNGQDPSNVLGKILRIDPRGTSSPNGQYGVPSDNPLVSAESPSTGGATGCADGACDEIYAWGFRNPFRFSFDATTGAMYVADVGQNDIEEVNVVTAGGNYGWHVKEDTNNLANGSGVPSGQSGVVMRIAAPASTQTKRANRARLTGGEQVPAPVDTPAIGQALFQLSDDVTSLQVKVMVTRIVDVIGAHIHMAAAGANGPIVASFIPDTADFLSSGPFVSTPINVTGVLVTGTITAADLVGPLAGQQMSALIDAIRAGNTYFNVHTVVHQPGEIRGQIR